MTALEIFGLGCLGGAVPDVIRLVKARHDGPPPFVKTVFFWIMFAVLIVLGGLAARYGGAAGVKEALAFGFGAPEIISRLLGGGEADRGADQVTISAWTRLQRWWAI